MRLSRRSVCLVDQRPAVVAVVQQHVRRGRVAQVRHHVVDADRALAQGAGDGPSQLQNRAEDAVFLYHRGDAHFEPVCSEVGLYDGFDLGGGVADAPVQTSPARFIVVGRSGVAQAASRQEAAAKRPQPFDALIGVRPRRRHAGMAEPGEAVLIVEGVHDVQCPIDDHFVSQPGACVDPRDSRALAQPVIENAGLDAAHLCGIAHAVLPVERSLFQCHLSLLLVNPAPCRGPRSCRSLCRFAGREAFCHRS